MKKILGLLVGLLLLSPFPLLAETLRIDAGLALDFTLPAERWTLTREAPAFLVEENAEHLEHELKAQGRRLEAAALRSEAQKRLAVNEGYLCNPASGACLLIDFSALRADEKAPGAKIIAASARAAAEGMAEEEGMTEVEQKSGPTTVAGADSSYRFDVSYRQHGEPRRMIGIVGFRSPYWFYLYFTDPQRDPADYPDMEKILGSVVLRGTGAKQ
jgi:hypothetical protein